MDALGPIDLHHQGAPRVIGCYLIETQDGLALQDCGPETCVPQLEEALAERGHALTDVRHLLLSHIHLDHCGAVGTLVRKHPGLQVHVHEAGAPHLADPTRLERSSRRLYGDLFDGLWGEVVAVPEENLHPLGDRAAGLEVIPTPGHASHHVCYLADEGTLYAGDAAGVRVIPDTYVSPPAVPPEFDLDTWLASIDVVERLGAERLALIHFGVVEDDIPAHLDQLRGRLARWANDEAPEEQWLERRVAERAGESVDPDANELAMPLWQSYRGLRRYWDKLAETGGSTEPTTASR